MWEHVWSKCVKRNRAKYSHTKRADIKTNKKIKNMSEDHVFGDYSLEMAHLHTALWRTRDLWKAGLSSSTYHSRWHSQTRRPGRQHKYAAALLYETLTFHFPASVVRRILYVWVMVDLKECFLQVNLLLPIKSQGCFACESTSDQWDSYLSAKCSQKKMQQWNHNTKHY